MAALLITDIHTLAGLQPAGQTVLPGKDMARLDQIHNAWILCEDGVISNFGTMDALPTSLPSDLETRSSGGGFVLPSWCDSHSHIIFAAPREEEFAMKIAGKSYEEIAAAGGGILNSAAKLQHAPEELLFEAAASRLRDMITQGTGALEIKSGYGLSTDAEIKMLRVIRKLKETFPIPIRASFLAAHAYPQQYKEDHEGYIRMIIDQMLPRVAGEGLADYMDVFCEHGFFSLDDTNRLLDAAGNYGLLPKIHANQLSISGAVQMGIKHHAVSVDHLELTDNDAIQALANSSTIATLLPSCSFYLGIPYANARALMNANVPLALASDYNPGSTPSGNMNFVASLGCIKLKMMPEEVINACTLNGAAAMELSSETGSITVGKRANLILTRPMSSLAYLPYSFGQSQIAATVLNGKYQ